MERLTGRNESGVAYYPYCFREDTCEGMGTGGCDSCVFMLRVCETLAGYEDAVEELNVESIQKDFNGAADDILEYVCENLCKIPVNRAYTQEDVDAFCDKCRLGERVKSLKDAHKELCSQVDRLYLQKCREVNGLHEKYNIEMFRTQTKKQKRQGISGRGN